MKESELFRALEIDAKELEAISKQYDESSPQHATVRRAAWALTYVVMHRRKEFAAFLTEMSGDLTDSDRKQLREFGLDDEPARTS